MASCFASSDGNDHLYTIPVSEPGDGNSSILRGPKGVESLFTPSDAMKTCYDIFKVGLKVDPNARCLGYRPVDQEGKLGEYQWMNYSYVDRMAKDLGSGIVNLNLSPEVAFTDESQQSGKFRFLCIYAKNRPEWNMLELACSTQGITVVPMYDTLGVDGLKFICSQTSLTTICCTSANLKNVIEAAKTPGATIRNVILLDAMGDDDWNNASEVGITLHTINEVEAAGQSNPQPIKEGNPDDICILMYTSGTTGNPKGVMTSNKMLCAMIPKLDTLENKLNSTDCLLSYLPSAHIFDRMTAFVVYYLGGRLGFGCGDVTKLLDDCEKLKPTIFPCVPRVLNRFHAKIMDKLNEKKGLAQMMITRGMKSKLHNLDQSGDASHWLWDALVFSKVKTLLGGNVRLIICGAAPIAPSVLRDFRAFFSCPVVEVYGMTETTGGGCLAYDRDPGKEGGVGGPNTELELKLVSVPEMNYHADKPDGPIQGEICFRGPSVTPGYFRAADLTAEAFDKDGWFHSGDVGVLMANGGIKVIDRKKNIFKLAQGEYLCPEKIEQVYLRAPPVGQVFLHGDSDEVYPVAVVVCNDDWLKREKLTCDSPETKKAVKAAMDAAADQAKLLGFEKAKDIYISKEAFSMDNGLLTPTMKIKRHEAKIRYLAELKAMYAKLKSDK